MGNTQDAVIEFPLGAPQAGEIFAGKYRIDRVLGIGGMGYVLAATHVQLDERVAIKLLLPELAQDGNTVQRFVREGRAAVKIRSEHVGKVLDVAIDDGTPYMVMEYLDGCDLAQLLEKSGRLPVPLAVDYVLQACEAVAEAHAMKTVHRDLKPANMFLIRRANGTDCVKVLDFGISKVTTPDSANMSMTKTNTMLGSPLYMSPEQLKSSRDVDERSDIWSLGVILYETVSGKPPFNAQSLPELGAMVLSGAPPYLQHAVPECPVGFADVIATCLRKEPLDRFTSLADFAQAVAPFGSPAALGSVERIVAVLGVPAARATLGSLHSNPLPATDPNGSGQLPAFAGTGPASWGTGSRSGPQLEVSAGEAPEPRKAWTAAVPATRPSAVLAAPRAAVAPKPHTIRAPQPHASTTPAPTPSAPASSGFTGSRFD